MGGQITTGVGEDVERTTLVALSNQVDLSTADAEVLSRFSGEALDLQVTKLNSGAARLLFSWPGKQLALNRMEKMTGDVAHFMQEWKGETLELNSFEEVKRPLAKALSEWKGQRLELNGLKNLELEIAEPLFQWKGKILSLNSVEKLAPKLAQKLGQWQGEELSLDGLTVLTPEIALYLFQWKGLKLSLNGIKEISPENTEKLVNWGGTDLYLEGVERISPTLLSLLSTWKGKTLSLRGVLDLDEESAKQLILWNGALLSLHVRNRLEDRVSRLLIKYQGTQIEFNGKLLDNRNLLPVTYEGKEFFEKGLESIEEKDFEKARGLFISFLKKTKDLREKSVNMQPYNIYEEKWDEILEHFATLDQDIVKAQDLFEKAKGLQASRNYDESIAHLDQTLALDPTFMDAYFERGTSYFGKKEIENARKDWLKYLEGTVTSTDSQVQAKRNKVKQLLKRV
jgi:tetratricopeptide (TPR) repeat protein